MWWLALLGCSRCTPVEAIEALPGDDQGLALAALLDFQRWSDHPICLSPTKQQVAGRQTRAEVFHDQCASYDRETGIASTRPDLFDGFGLDPSKHRTEAQRIREDFARACADASDQHPWVFAARSTCGLSLDPEDAFLTELFGGEGLTERPLEATYLGQIEGQGLVFLEGLVVSRHPIEAYEWGDPQGDQLYAYSLPELELLWTEFVEDAQYAHLLGGVDSTLVEHRDRAWVADSEGLHPLPTPSDTDLWGSARNAAPHPDGTWWVEGYGEIFTYDPATGAILPGVSDARALSPHRDGPVLWTETHLEQPTTGRRVAFPWWSDYQRFSGGKLHAWVSGRIDDRSYKLELARTLEPGAQYELNDVTCDWPFGGAFNLEGIDGDYLIDDVWPEDPREPRRLDIWLRTPVQGP